MASFDPSRAVQSAFAAAERGDWAEAERQSRTVLAAKPDHFEALYLLAIIAGRAGRPQHAAELLAKAVAVRPDHADAHYNRGVALEELGRPEEALASYDRALACRRDHVGAHYNRGVVLGQLERTEEAAASYARAVALQPDHAEAHHNRGVALAELGRASEALASYDQAIALRPQYASAYNHRGAALAALGRQVEALQSYDRAIALKPDYAGAYDNRGVALMELDRVPDALASHERALALQPDSAQAHYHRGNALRALHRHPEAVASYRRALELEPEHASAHWNLADCLLLLGDFVQGWKEYEWRWKFEAQARPTAPLQPVWLGHEPLAGRTILLQSELGLGDTLLFCRYAEQVAGLGARVILQVQPPLVPLLSGMQGVAEVVPAGMPPPAFDYRCPMMSLPLAFRTDLATIPASVPYVRSDPSRVAAWAERLGAKERRRIALVWSGSAKIVNDKRSMRLSDVVALLRDGVDWLSLQKEVPQGDAALLASRADIGHLGAELNDFADTAAVLDMVDLVLTIDTSVANLAGAMARPVWIMLPYSPHDWRWLLERSDSPWYPTARLFRQPRPGDWSGVIDRVGAALDAWLADSTLA